MRRRKRSLLQFQYDLSDSQVVRQAQVNGAFRVFLDLSVESPVPVPSWLSQLRTRLGEARCGRIFNEIVRPARAHGRVKDRRRWQDATQLIAKIAIPATLRWGAQTREQRRHAAARCAATEGAAQRAQGEVLRAATVELPEDQRGLARVTHWRELGGWGEQWQQRGREAADRAPPLGSEEPAAAFAAALELAPKGLNAREPAAPDKLLSLTDREARTGKHGDYYKGYLLEVSREADSERRWAVEVLPATGDEAAPAQQLIAREEQAHGNEVASLSLARLGDRGAVRAELSEAAEGPQLTVSVPPMAWLPPAPELLHPDVCTLTAAGAEVRCPGGATTRTRRRAQRGHGWRFRFSAAQCRTGPVRAQCRKPDTQGGRRGIKNDYAAQYRAAQQRAPTPADQEVRRAQPRIERQLADVLRWHAGRRVRYRGRLRVKIQYLLTAVVGNCKRMVKLLSVPLQPQLT